MKMLNLKNTASSAKKCTEVVHCSTPGQYGHCRFLKANFTNKAVILIGLLWLASPASAYPGFQMLIPNGDKVVDVCDRTQFWLGIGHENPEGGGRLNVFGRHFVASRKMWTVAFCQQDSDGDGLTNGQELGDPDCTWRPAGSRPPQITDSARLSHPGICEPFDSPRCAGKNSFLLRLCPEKLLMAKKCSIPTSPRDSYILRTSAQTSGTYTVGDFIDFQCAEGYVMKGTARAVCQQNGTWTDLPICIYQRSIRIATCSQPRTMPLNAYVFSQPSSFGVHNYAVGSLIQYECNPGYSSEGYGITACLQDGTWSDTSLKCTAIEVVANDLNIRRLGASIARGGQEWDVDWRVFPSAMQKLEQCMAPNNLPSNAIVVSGFKGAGVYSPGDVLTLGCEPGYTMEGCGFIMCQDSGFFTSPQMSCRLDRPIITCPPPTLTGNAQLSPGLSGSQPVANGRYAIGNSITIVCPTGYIASNGNQASKVCQSDGTWAGCDLDCRLVQTTCSNPPIPPNTRTNSRPSNGNQFVSGDSVTYECNQGFAPSGNPQITCQNNGRWSELTFCCVARPAVVVTCREPIYPLNSCPIMAPATSQNGTYFVGDVVLLGCINGFFPRGSSGRLTGTAQITCQSNGQWSPTDFYCDLAETTTPQIMCQSPDLPTFSRTLRNSRAIQSGNINPGQYSAGDYVQYGCQTGYIIPGTIQCLGDGSWSASSMFCQARANLQSNTVSGTSGGTCTAPRPPSNATPIQRATSFSVGEFIQYECNSDYTNTGIVTCLRDGTWTAAVFACENTNNLANAVVTQPPAVSFPPTKPGPASPVPTVTCSPPPTPANAQVVGQLVLQSGQTWFPVGAFFVFQCNSGYRIVGDAVILCNTDGTWTDRPTCMPN